MNPFIEMKSTLIRTVSEDFYFRLIHELSSLTPLKTSLGSFQIFSKIHRDICKSRCTTSIIDTGGKFATVIKNTSVNFAPICGKFARGVKISAANYRPVSLTQWQNSTISTTPAVSLLPGEMTQVAIYRNNMRLLTVHPKVNLNEIFFNYLFPLLPKGVQTK